MLLFLDFNVSNFRKMSRIGCLYSTTVRVQVLTGVTVNIIIFTDMTPRSLVDAYQRSVLTEYPDGGGSIILGNVGIYFPVHTV